jgi:hypothetical protein
MADDTTTSTDTKSDDTTAAGGEGKPDDTATTTASDDTKPDPELESIRSDPAGAHKTIAALKAEAADYRRRLRQAESERDDAKTASMSEQERAVAEAEKRGRQAAEAEHGRRLLEAQIRAAAAGKLRDPDDAIRYLDVDKLLELDERDRDLDKAVATLIEQKSYLAADTNGATPTTGVRSQGARTQPGGTRAADSDGSEWLRKAARGGRR